MHGELRRHRMATRVVQEAGILEDIHHPGVVRVYECSILPDHRPWIAMELVDGDALATRLHYTSRLPATGSPLLADVPTCSPRSCARRDHATSSPTTCCSHPAIGCFRCA
jgi:serine/threonine protein kinase